MAKGPAGAGDPKSGQRRSIRGLCADTLSRLEAGGRNDVASALRSAIMTCLLRRRTSRHGEKPEARA